MRPDDLAKSGSEHAHQVALFAYVAMATRRGFDEADRWANGEDLPPLGEDAYPRLGLLRWFHAIPNGGARGNARDAQIRGANLKAEGVRSGVADTFLPYPAGGYHGLYIEMKKPSEKPKREGSKGGVSDEQRDFGEYVKSCGFGWVVCYSWREAADMLRMYVQQ